MNTGQLLCAIQCDRVLQHKVCGVYASDLLPKERPVQGDWGCVANTDPHLLPGKHWVGFYFERKTDKGYFFDSYGHSPLHYNAEFVTFLNEHCKEWTYNETCLQSKRSRACGFYVLFYLLYRCRGVDRNNAIIHMFSNDPVANDIFVSNFMCHYFQKCYSICTLCDQSNKSLV